MLYCHMVGNREILFFRDLKMWSAVILSLGFHRGASSLCMGFERTDGGVIHRHDAETVLCRVFSFFLFNFYQMRKYGGIK